MTSTTTSSGLQIAYGPSTSRRHLSVAAVAQDLDVAPNIVHKALQMGILPDLSYLTVDKVTSHEQITRLADAHGLPIPVLRLGVRNEDVSGDPPEDARTCYGYDINMTPEELEGSVLRYWRPQYVQRTVEVGVLPVVAASFVVAVAEIHGSMRVGDRYAFTGRLIAHTTSVVDNEWVIDAADSPWCSNAAELINSRLLGGGGGSLTLSPI